MSDISATLDTTPALISEGTHPNTLLQRITWPVVVALSCLLAALATTWPLATKLDSAVLRGTEQVSTTQLLSIWTLWWNADRASDLFNGYWDAPFFYPTAGVFTFSEPEPLTGLAVAPLWSLGAPPALIYNVALLLILTLNGIFAYRLARALSVTRPTALAVAILAVTLPFVSNMIGVLNLVPIFGMLWTLDGLVRFGATGENGYAWWAAAGVLATFLTCQQYALMFFPFALAAGILALKQQEFKRDAIIRLAAAGAAAGAIVLFIALPSLAVHDRLEFSRPQQAVMMLSAQPVDFITRPTTSWFDLPPRYAADTGGLFPGLVLLVLAVAGLRAGTEDKDRKQGHWAIFFATSIILAGVLAIGLNLEIFGFRPFQFLRLMVPGYSELRSPFRFAIIVQALLPLLAAFFLVKLENRFARVGAALVLGIAMLGSIENLALPQPVAQMPTSVSTDWTAWLRTQPDDTVVAHVPFPKGLSVSAYEVEGWRMLTQIDHRKPIVNGYSGNFPPGYTNFQLDMAENFPTYGLLCTLTDALGVNTVVIDKPWLEQNRVNIGAYSSFLKPAKEFSGVAIYSLQAPANACQK